MSNRLRQIYADMKTRCYNSKSKHYKWYGARGIKVCSEWLNTETVPSISRGRPCIKGWLAFEEWALNNGYSEELTLDRIDVNKGYSPDNCCWSTMKEQANNKTKGCYRISYKGQTKNILEWAKVFHIPYSSLWIRITHGDKLEDVLRERTHKV